jgi:hypothetical protein
MTRIFGVWLIVGILAGLAPVASAEQSPGTVLQSVLTVEEGGRTLVTIQADGPLPMPTHDLVDRPPRIYLDLTDVRPKATVALGTPAVGIVARARVALHSVNPTVTRVVLDLTRRETYRVDSDERHLGRIRILVGAASGTATVTPPARSPSPVPPTTVPGPRPAPAPAAPVSNTPTAPSAPVSTPPAATIGKPAPVVIPRNPAPVAPPATGAFVPPASPPASASAPVSAPPPPPPPPPASSPSPAAPATGPSRIERRPTLTTQTPARPALPAGEVNAYRRQLSGALERLQARRAIIASIDANEEVAPPALVTASEDFNDLRKILTAIKPSAAVKATHELLVATCNLGAMAVSLRVEVEHDNRPDRRGNAASAAAGALMFFDLACADLGCGKPAR